MGEEKRFIVFLILTMLVVVLTPMLFQWIGGPGPGQQPRPGAQAKAPVEKPEDPNQPDGAEPAPVQPDEGPRADDLKPNAAAEPDQEPVLEFRTLGSTDPESGFFMRVVLNNRGAAVKQIELSQFQNEFRTGPLQLLATSDDEEGSVTLGLKGLEARLAERNWEIVPVQAGDDAGREPESVRFQTSVPEEGLVITKTYSLQKGSYTLGLEIDIRNTSQKVAKVAYRLGGPRGLVLEGAWYATKKREVAIADAGGTRLNRQVRPTELVKGAKKILELADGNGTIPQEKWAPLPPEWFERFDRNQDRRLSGAEVDAAATHLASSERFMERPVRFSGVDGQFFCALLVVPAPPTPQDRWDAETWPVLRLTEKELRELKCEVWGLERTARALQLTDDEVRELKQPGKLQYPDRCDVSVEIVSQNFDLAAGESLNHTFTLYGGPRKKTTLLQALGDPVIAQAVMNYQGALFVFPPTLVSLTASTMLTILDFFHRWVGNWGVAIIMLTVMVRLLMFPLSRKQALAAVKMQALKPELDALREKYKNDKEKLSRAQMELWRKHNVNPLGGCLPLVIQMPIFIGLWQGLQSSVDLRQARFLWIDNLAAPDGPSVKFFHWGENIPIISWAFGPYFNLLPAILIGLFMIQQKLFMPPKSASVDPQVEMQQKMMTYMLVFFGYIFWRLPSGLCLYYIASTSWGIAERKLLPKLQHAEPISPAASANKSEDSGDRKSRTLDRGVKGNGRDSREKRSAERRTPTFTERLQELLKKAEKR